MTFSVPALLPVSWPAPCMNFSESHPLANVKRTHALRSIELVSRNAQQIDAQFGRIDGDLACGLGRIGVHQDAPLAGHSGDLADRLDRPHLVVGVHDAHQDGPFRDGFFESLHVDDPVRIDGHTGDLVPVSGQELADLRDGGMFEGRGDDVITLPAMHPCSAFDGMVVRFRPAAREEDLGGAAVEQLRHLPAAFSTPLRAATPNAWLLEGLPKCSRM